MLKIPEQLKNGAKEALIKLFTVSLPLLLVSLLLFGGGIIILALNVSGWSLILGLPAVQIGIVLLIFTFDEIAQKKLGINSLYITACSVCRDPVVAHVWEKEKVCAECQKKIAQKLKIK